MPFGFLCLFLWRCEMDEKAILGKLKYLINNYCYQDNKTITLEVSCANIPAYSLYKKLNFKVVGKRSKYYGDEDAYIMKWGNNE